MITLFLKTGCGFCARTIAAFDAYGIPYEEKNVSDPEVVRELIALGGKKQEPFMVDGDTMMYEANSIINYIEQKYAQSEGDGLKKPKIHYVKGIEVCPT